MILNLLKLGFLALKRMMQVLAHLNKLRKKLDL